MHFLCATNIKDFMRCSKRFYMTLGKTPSAYASVAIRFHRPELALFAIGIEINAQLSLLVGLYVSCKAVISNDRNRIVPSAQIFMSF